MNRKKLYAAAALAVAISIALIGCGGTTSNSSSGSKAAAAKSTPSATPATDWYAKTFGTFTPVSQAGSGAAVIKIPAGAKGGIVTATYSGSDNFSIQGLTSANAQTSDLLVNTIGNYKGVTAFGMETLGGADASLQVTATAAWTINISPIDSATSLPPSGTGDGVFKYDGKAGTWKITNTDPSGSNFVVSQLGSNAMPNQAVNEIGNYSGTVPSQAGPSVIVINSAGNWAISQ